MKLVMFRNVGDPRLGVLEGNRVIDLNLACEAMLAAGGDARARDRAALILPPETIRFLEAGAEGREGASKALAWIGGRGGDLSVRGMPIVFAKDGIRLLPPVMKPAKIICVAHNYHDFLKELGMSPHPEPRIFAKFANAVIGYDEPIPRPAMTRALGYEAELAFVVGKRCKHVPEQKAYDCIAGYMAFNDVSASDLTKKDVQNLRGKSFDGFAPMGPYLLTADELPDPHNLSVKLRVNGRVLQESNTRQLVHNVPQLFSFCSEIFTLEPGDVVATGTPGGLAKDRTPPTFMQPGDIMETEIEGLGLMRNPIVGL